MKYLYVLVSDDSDYYLENAMLSISSLRMHTPQAFVSLLMDSGTEKTLTGKRRAIVDLVDEILVPAIEGNWTKRERSRWLKTSARAHIAGDFLYIDCDTVIAGDLSLVSGLDMELGAVMDAHTTWDEDISGALRKLRDQYRKWDKALGFESSLKTNRCFNSGVILCRDTLNTHRFFAKWHELWQYSHLISPMDQTPLNQTDYLFQGFIREMDGVWNCQVYAPGMLQYLSSARIIHFWGGGVRESETFYRLASPSFFAQIKESGHINAELRDLLRFPRAAFYEKTYLAKEVPFLYSPTFVFLKKLYKLRLIRWLDAPLGLLLDLYVRARATRGGGGKDGALEAFPQNALVEQERQARWLSRRHRGVLHTPATGVLQALSPECGTNTGAESAPLRLMVRIMNRLLYIVEPLYLPSLHVIPHKLTRFFGSAYRFAGDEKPFYRLFPLERIFLLDMNHIQ